MGSEMCIRDRLKAACLELRKHTNGGHVSAGCEVDVYSAYPECRFDWEFSVYTGTGGTTKSKVSLDDAVGRAVEALAPERLIAQAKALELAAAQLREKAAARKEGVL